MAGERLQFGWDVPSAGFRWLQTATVAGESLKRPQPALVPVERDAVGVANAPHLAPEPDPAVFRAFAEIRPDKEGVLAFASRHGNLFDGVELVPATRTDTLRGQPLSGVLLETWQYHIADVQRLVGLWDLLQHGDPDRLAPHIQWRRDGKEGVSVRFDSHPPAGKGQGPALGFRRVRDLIASRDTRPELLATFTPEDPFVPGWAYLQQVLENRLFDANVSVEARMIWDVRRKRPALRLAAPTLLSAVWFQLADAVSNDRTFTRCRECGRWFEVAPDAARTHRRFCSNSCRSKAYRERQDRARQLHVAGKTFAEIAQELDSDVTTVRRWITGEKE
jgi:hypothetical protein